MKLVILALLAVSVASTIQERNDNRYDEFLSDLHRNDRNAARQLIVEERKNFLFPELPRETTSSSYAALEDLFTSKNFNGYFDFFKNTDLYEKMVSELMRSMNMSPGSLEKMIKEMWVDFFKTDSKTFPNWFAVYLEQHHGKFSKISSKVIDQSGVYAVWFQTTDNVQVKRTFFHGTSPEFDMIAYTMCALQTSRGQESKTCSFELDGTVVSVHVRTKHVRSNIKILSVEPRQVVKPAEPKPKSELDEFNAPLVKQVIDDFGRRTRRPPPNDASFQKYVDRMWEADVDRAQKGDVVLDWQNKVGQGHGKLNPLFKSVNETLFERPVYKALKDIWDGKVFSAPVCKEELPMQGQKKALVQKFFETVTKSPIFSITLEYLTEKKVYNEDKKEKFYDDLFKLWFGTYTRCHSPLGSSGFEHVFIGETKGGTVDGHHNWYHFYLDEKAGLIKYKGYYDYKEDLIGTIQYDWNNAHKPKGGFFITPSPAFDFSVFTACTLTQTGSQRCKFNINGEKLFVTSFQQICHDGHCLATSYPGIL